MDAVTGEDKLDPARARVGRDELRAFLELFALSGIAVVQPLLDALRKNTHDTFVSSGASRFQILALVVAILFVPPAVLWAIEAIVGLVRPESRRLAHAALAGFLIGIISLVLIGQLTELSTGISIAIALPLAIGGAYLVFRFDVLRMFLRYLAFAPILFTILFLMNDQVSPLVFTSAPAANAAVTVGRPDRVVMIVMDEFPLSSLLDGTGHVDAELYPNFAALADGSTWYRNTTTVAPYTSAAVPALLTGNLPTETNAVSTAAVYPNNLFTLLGATYRLNTHENLEELNPNGDAAPAKGVGWMIDRSVSLWKNLVLPRDAGSRDLSQTPPELLDQQVPAVRRFIDSLDESKQRQLDYLHVLLPHVPWHLLPDGRSYTETLSVQGAGAVWQETTLLDVGRQRHLLQLQATDRMLGQIVARLRNLGVYDRSLVVVTADHGAGLTVGSPLRKATAANYSDVMWIPLFVKAPGQVRGAIDDRPASSVDVMPTVAEMVGADVPWKLDGHSLLGEPRPEQPRPLLKLAKGFMAPLLPKAVYEKWDGPKGFARVLATPGVPAGDDPTLRVYRGFSKYGDLVGRPAASMIQPGDSGISARLLDPRLFKNVDVDGDTAPWTYLRAHLDQGVGRQFAITVNGTVAGLATGSADPFGGGASLVGVLPPQLFRDGNNQIRIYKIEGPPDAPRLVAVPRSG